MESAAQVVGYSPADHGVGAPPDPHLQVTFRYPMHAASFTSDSVQLLQNDLPEGQQQLAARVSYNPANYTATIDPISPLPYGERFTVHLLSGSTGVRSAYFFRELKTDLSFDFNTAPSPTVGAGGPILLITSASQPFSSYYAEILKAEGLNEFSTTDISSLSALQLSNAHLVLLGEIPLTDDQSHLLTDYVRAGGKLIAMRPDRRLAGVMGISPSGTSIFDAYLKFDNRQKISAGLTNTTIQFHGPADFYSLNGATAIAGLYSTSESPLPNPAITLNKFGDRGGEAAAFTYDLARSVILTRQGNPAWAHDHRDGQTVGRSDDELLGPAKSPWLDLTKLKIPQADQQQRLLANLIAQMTVSTGPLPRFWYMPNGAHATLILTGDDHNNGGSLIRWKTYLKMGKIGGEPIGATAYIFPGSHLKDRKIAPYIADGYEVALHVDICPPPIFVDQLDVPTDWTSPQQLDSIYTDQLAIFNRMYPSLPAPITNRTHGVVWSDFDSQPKVEFKHNIRMDTNYYFWPPTWITDRPGLFTGSGIPMRFAAADGSMIDCFQQSTIITDESGESYDYFVDALLDQATNGSEAYGDFGVNAHGDENESATAEATIKSAQKHNVPIITAERLLKFTDARDNSTFDNINWDPASRTLSFGVTVAINGNDLQAMLPLSDGAGNGLASLSINGMPTDVSRELLAGVEYGRFSVASGDRGKPLSVIARYAADATPNLITVFPNPESKNVPHDSVVKATFQYPIDATSISLLLKDFKGAIVPATVQYDAANCTITLTPRQPLRSGFPYTAVVAAIDSAGRPVGPLAWSFKTARPALDSSTYSFFPDSTRPEIQSANDAQSVEVGMQFSSDVAGFIRGIRFYKGAQNAGPHVIHLWDDNGDQLAEANVSTETTDGWQSAQFKTPIVILPGRNYVASYHCPSGHYAYSNGYFAHLGIDVGPIHLVASDQIGGGNGVFNAASRNINNEIGHPTSFPMQTNGASNYWVDVIFSPMQR